MTIETSVLQEKIEKYFAAGADAAGDRDALDAFLELRRALSAGLVRAAEPDPATPLGWRVNAWVKQGILLGFRVGTLVPMGGDDFSFRRQEHLSDAPLRGGARRARGAGRIVDA